MKQKSEIKRTGPELLKRLLRQREMSVFLIILLVVAIVAIVNPKFIQPSNMKSIALSVATDGLLSIGLTLALILGGIELSVGGVAAMTCVIAGQMALMGVNIWVACLAALAAGAVCGLFNGFMVSKVGLPPFIVTLSMMNLSRGVAYIITTGSPLIGVRLSAGQLPLSGHRRCIRHPRAVPDLPAGHRGGPYLYQEVQCLP